MKDILYSKQTQCKVPFSTLLDKFANYVKDDRSGWEFVRILYNRFTVEDFAFSDDWQYWTVHGYFEKVVIPHKIEVHKAGMSFIESGFAKEFLGGTLSVMEFKENLWLHDMSKFSANESFGYAFYNRETGSGKSEFNKSWHHHKMNNPHHPEYWYSVNKKGETELLEMSKLYVLEMVADWIGAGISYGNKIEDWLPKNINSFKFHEKTEGYLYDCLREFGMALENDNGVYKIQKL